MLKDLLERSDIEFIFNNVKRMASGANTEDTRDRIFEALHSSDIEKPLDILGNFIVMYWEEEIPWLNTIGLEEIKDKYAKIQKEKDIDEAKDSWVRIQKTLNGEFAWPFDIHMSTLRGCIKIYWEDFITWLTTQSLDEMQKTMDFTQAQEGFKKAEEYLTNWRGISLKKKLKDLIAFIQKYWENVVPWITYAKITEMEKACDSLLSTEQTWTVKKIIEKDHSGPATLHRTAKRYGFITTWASEVYFENPGIKLEEGDEVRFKVVPGEIKEYKITDIVVIQ